MSIMTAFNRLYPFDGNEDSYTYFKWLGNKYLDAAVHVWETGDYVGTSELLWRWWNIGVIKPQDILNFVYFVEQNTEDTSCVLVIDRMKSHAEELIAEEKRKNK